MDKVNKSDEEKNHVKRLVAWINIRLKFCLLTIIAFLPLQIFLDFWLGIIIFRDFGEFNGALFVCCVIFYAEFCKKFRDT